MTITTFSAVADLHEFINAGPTPWHNAAQLTTRLKAAGFVLLTEEDEWVLEEGKSYCVVRHGAPVAAFHFNGQDSLLNAGLRIAAAHIDSPGLRIKPRGIDAVSDSLGKVGVEVYGGPILATFSDRDLSLAGRVIVQETVPSETLSGLATRLVHFKQPLLRIPNAAIHINRDVNDKGLLLHKHTQLPPLIPLSDELTAKEGINRLLAHQLNLEPAQIAGYELCAYDTQPAAWCGLHQEWFTASRIDNLASCHALLMAIIAPATTGQTDASSPTPLALFFDHEEVGSMSAAGAASNFALSVIRRMTKAAGLSSEAASQICARSFMLSVDMAHAFHPGYAAASDDAYSIRLNGGPVIKYNAGQRYTTDAETAARFKQCCALEQIPYQEFVGRADVPCGSTVGPVLAAQLGVRSADVGNPMWAMHSIRETAGTQDHAPMIRVVSRFFVMPE